MATLTFYGAAGTVTGSRFLLEIDGQKNLVDCGLFQGTKENRLRNWEGFPVKADEINRVFLTHAHIDHTGYLPRLQHDGFRGKIHSTHATSQLCDIMLKDSAHLQEEDAYWANKKGFSRHEPALPLYTLEDVEKTLPLFAPMHYGEDLFLSDDLRIKFRDAGHILGSSIIDFKRSKGKFSRKIAFSGDFGRPDRPILREPDQLYNVNYLIMESTYGNRLHDDKAEPLDELARVINESVKRRGVLLIPSFAVGRTQSLLYAIRELEEAGRIPTLPVYVDSPMSILALEVFEKHTRYFDLTARKLSLHGKNVFRTANLHLTETREKSKAINQIGEKAIIISSSGMATGGRILHHLAARLPEKKHTVLLVGYQAQGTRGRALEEGHSEIKIHGQNVPVRAKIEQLHGFSGHGDYEEIIAWMMAFNQPPEKVFLVHGEPEASQAMAARIKEFLGWDVIIPAMGDRFELDI